MNVTSTAVSLTVDDVPAGAAFLARYLGFREAMAADGFASLVRDDTPDVILLRRGTEVLPEGFRDQPAAGVIIAFIVANLDADYERLKNEGAPVTIPLRAKPWGERLF